MHTLYIHMIYIQPVFYHLDPLLALDKCKKFETTYHLFIYIKDSITSQILFSSILQLALRPQISVLVKNHKVLLKFPFFCKITQKYIETAGDVISLLARELLVYACLRREYFLSISFVLEIPSKVFLLIPILLVVFYFLLNYSFLNNKYLW